MSSQIESWDMSFDGEVVMETSQGRQGAQKV